MLPYKSPKCTTKTTVENVCELGIFSFIRNGEFFLNKNDEKSDSKLVLI